MDASTPPSSPTGLCGLGNMGSAIATRLLTLGPVIGYDPDPARAEAAERLGVTRAQGLDQVAEARIVVLSLPSPAISREVLGTLLGTLRPGSLIVETSTCNAADVREMAASAQEREVCLFDAAILSGVRQMYDGESTLLVGGEENDLERARPVLEALGRERIHLGPTGSGAAAKVINNAVGHAVMVVLAEAGAMAAATGVSGKALAELLARPDAGLMRPLTHRFVERVLRGDYEGGMPSEVARKDSVLALELARDARVPLFAIQAAHSVYEMAVGGGLARQDYASMARLWESWTGRPFTP
ncbi:MAG: NAD(P)-dependent oxidoreductase [Candidatus Dormibacteraeota bacterium]|nr:NAD(P)-dependent oxidoreductase [Candidatus Dormibacteraeota bacterium]